MLLPCAEEERNVFERRIDRIEEEKLMLLKRINKVTELSKSVNSMKLQHEDTLRAERELRNNLQQQLDRTTVGSSSVCCSVVVISLGRVV